MFHVKQKMFNYIIKCRGLVKKLETLSAYVPQSIVSVSRETNSALVCDLCFHCFGVFHVKHPVVIRLTWTNILVSASVSRETIAVPIGKASETRRL